MMKYRRTVPLLCLIVSMTFLGSCAALVVGGAAGAGSFAYVSGELKTSENTSLNKGYKATLKAMSSLRYKVTKSNYDALKGSVVARESGDKKVQVLLKQISDGVTEFKIRVGLFGDEIISQAILKKIQANL